MPETIIAKPLAATLTEYQKKSMNADGTKVVGFDTVVNFGKEYSMEQKAIIENAARTCPVGNSLAKDIKRSFQFNY